MVRPTRLMPSLPILTSGLGSTYGGSSVNVLELMAAVFGYLAHGDLGPDETFDATDAGWHSGTLTEDCTFTLIAYPANNVSSLFIELLQDSTGGWAIDLPSSVVNATELEAAQVTTADETTLLVLLSRDGGTSWFGGWWGQSGGGTAIIVEDEGTPLATAVDTFNFVGAGVTASGTGGTKTITIPSGGDPVDDDYAWMPLTTVVAGEPVLVWDGDDNLIPTLTPV